MSDVSVVHLVRRRNGIEPLRAFVESNMRHQAGVSHVMVLVFKGFHGEIEPDYQKLTSSLPHIPMFISDSGRDISSFRYIASRLRSHYVCFLNSFSVLESDQWLAKLVSGISARGVGLAGASGSWQSLDSDYHVRRAQRESGPIRSVSRIYRTLRYRMSIRGSFPLFPNPHVRTNGFIIERERFLRSYFGPLRTKMDYYRFESGNQSLSRQLVALGLGLRVIDRNGKSYPPEEWRESRTFWIEEQENLMISDNQTNYYRDSNSSTRAELRQFAWGESV